MAVPRKAETGRVRLSLAREADRYQRIRDLDRRMKRTRLLRRCLPVLLLLAVGWVAFHAFVLGARNWPMAFSGIVAIFALAVFLEHLARKLNQRLGQLRREMGEEVRIERDLPRRTAGGPPTG